MEGSRQSYLTSEVTGQAVIDREQQNLFALLNANNYPKGGWVLHMLRGIVGDEGFFAGVRAYYQDFGGANAGSGDFRDAMESASGRDLDWFFDQWLEQPGYPVLAMEHRWEEASNELVVTIRQEQGAGWPTFRLPLEIEAVLGDDMSERWHVEITERRQVFRLPVPRPPRTVRLDPDGWVLKTLSALKN